MKVYATFYEKLRETIQASMEWKSKGSRREITQNEPTAFDDMDSELLEPPF